MTKLMHSTITLYKASVPVFLRYLERLNTFVDLAQAHTQTTSSTESAILSAHLAPDMLPFETQIATAAHFALRASFPLAGKQIPVYGDFPASFDGLRARLLRSVTLLHDLQLDNFKDAESRVIESKAGNANVSLPAEEFLLQYALPNFFFHVTTAYAILRSHGVKIGKEQFDGFHVYSI
jgi:uncharacterized protein